MQTNQDNVQVVDKSIVKDESRLSKEIKKRSEGYHKNMYDIMDLLLEAQEKSVHTAAGFLRFGEWVESLNIDLGERQAFYLITTAKKARTLGISRETLMKVKFSKVKEIFALDPAEYGDKMKVLLQAAELVSLEAIKADIAKLKAKEGEEPVSYMTLKVESTVKETIQEAFEVARAQYGSVDAGDGTAKDISDSKALELICVAYLQDPNNKPVVEA